MDRWIEDGNYLAVFFENGQCESKKKENIWLGRQAEV